MENSSQKKYSRKLAFGLALIYLAAVALMWGAFEILENHTNIFPPACDSLHTYSLPAKNLPPFIWRHTGVVTLWFDDAWLSQFTAAAPLLEKAGFIGTLSVPVKFVCTPNFMTWNQIRILQSKGWEITSHSINHSCDLRYYTPQAIEYELAFSKQLLKTHGLRADHFVMPCGYSRYNIISLGGKNYPHIVETASKYYMSYRTTDGNKINPLPVTHPYNLKSFVIHHDTSNEKIKELVQTTMKEKGWLILVFHQIGENQTDKTQQEFAINEEKLQEILNTIQLSKLPVISPTQALGIQKLQKIDRLSY